jgi:hypothetical protein
MTHIESTENCRVTGVLPIILRFRKIHRAVKTNRSLHKETKTCGYNRQNMRGDFSRLSTDSM